MTTVGITDDDKETYEELRPDHMNQAEFTGELLKAYKANQNGGVDMDHMIREITKHIDHTTAPKCELAAKRAINEVLEE